MVHKNKIKRQTFSRQLIQKSFNQMKEKYERRISKLNKYFKGDLIMSPSKGLTPSNDYLERKLAQSPVSKTSMDTKRNTHLTPMAKKSIMS